MWPVAVVCSIVEVHPCGLGATDFYVSPHAVSIALPQELPACEDHFRNSGWKSSLLSAAKLIQDDRSVKWFPKYGCALLAILSRDVSNEPIARRHLYIVGLDSWVLKAHWIRSSGCVFLPM